MLINNLYEVQLRAEENNVGIDETTTVTVTVTDFNNNPLSDITVNITVDKGIFKKFTRNNTDTNISGTSTKSYDGITGDDGTFTMTYEAKEWGLCTISADVNKTQIFVTGFKEVNVSSTNHCVFSVDESSRSCKLVYTVPVTSIGTGSSTLIDTIGIPNKYKPYARIGVSSYAPQVVFNLLSDGRLMAKASGSTFNHNSSDFVFEWHY